MIGLDTNVLVRYLAQDDPEQSALATELVEGLSADEPGHISLVALIEAIWVLESCYAMDKPGLCSLLAQLLQSQELVVQDAATVWKALRAFQAGAADFADCLIERSCAACGCTATLTFDRAAARTAGMQLLG